MVSVARGVALDLDSISAIGSTIALSRISTHCIARKDGMSLTTVHSSFEQPNVPMCLPPQLLPSLWVADTDAARTVKAAHMVVEKCILEMEELDLVCFG